MRTSSWIPMIVLVVLGSLLFGCATDRPREGRSLAATAPQADRHLFHAGAAVFVQDETPSPSLRFGYTRALNENLSLHLDLETLVLISDLTVKARVRPIDALGLDFGLTGTAVVVPGQSAAMVGPHLGLWTSREIGALQIGGGLSTQLYLPCLTGVWINASPPRTSCLAPAIRPKIVIGIPFFQQAVFDFLVGTQHTFQSDGIGFTSLELGAGISW